MATDSSLCACRNRIDLILNTKVKAVSKNSVRVADANGHERDIPFGACVWATGVAMHPVIKQVTMQNTGAYLFSFSSSQVG